MEWAPQEPEKLNVVRARLARRRENFVQGSDFFYLIFDPAEQMVLGSTGLHPRAEPGTLETGYSARDCWRPASGDPVRFRATGIFEMLDSLGGTPV